MYERKLICFYYFVDKQVIQFHDCLNNFLQYFRTDAPAQQIQVKDFGPSWRDGHAFNVLIHNIRQDLVDLEKLQERSNSENLDNAFSLAERELGIMKLLEPKGLNIPKKSFKY